MGSNEYNYLRFVRFKGLSNWSVGHILGMNMDFTNSFPMVPIRTVLKRSSNLVEIKDNVEYKQITLKTNGGGAVLRGVKVGRDIGTKKQYVVSSGQFIMSKIDARNGAFGVVTDDLDGAIVTADFPVFNVDSEKIIPQYLFLLSSTKAFARFAQSCSRGTTNRQRIDINLFLSQRIPLPSLTEQRALISAHEAKCERAVVLDKKISQIEKGIEYYMLQKLGISKNNEMEDGHCGHIRLFRFKKITKWSIDNICKNEKYDFENANYSVLKIKDVLAMIEGGGTPDTSINEYWDGNIFWVSAKDMKELFLNNIQDTITKIAVEKCGLKIYPENTILCVFRSGILRHSFPICITKVPTTINQDVKALIIDEKKVSKLFFIYYLDTLQDLVLNIAQKKGVTVESINTDDFLNIPFVMPSLAAQNDIVEHINEQKAQIKQLKQQTQRLRKSALIEFEKAIFKQ